MVRALIHARCLFLQFHFGKAQKICDWAFLKFRLAGKATVVDFEEVIIYETNKETYRTNESEVVLKFMSQLDVFSNALWFVGSGKLVHFLT